MDKILTARSEHNAGIDLEKNNAIPSLQDVQVDKIKVALLDRSKIDFDELVRREVANPNLDVKAAVEDLFI